MSINFEENIKDATPDNNKADCSKAMQIQAFEELFHVETHYLQKCDVWMLLFSVAHLIFIKPLLKWNCLLIFIKDAHVYTCTHT